jgi:hypothetical protein
VIKPLLCFRLSSDQGDKYHKELSRLYFDEEVGLFFTLSENIICFVV